MTAKAHVTVGMAAALTIMEPDSVRKALPVVAGAAVGSLICDFDIENQAEKRSSSHWRIVTCIITAVAFLEDYLLDAGMIRSITESGSFLWFFGAAGFAVTCIFAGISSHRGFSHSLTALALESLSLLLVFPMTVMPFAIAFLSHVILDLMNKKPVRLLYPLKKGYCLGLFYADRLADKLCAAGGTVWLIVAVILCLRQR